ncbi:MAG: hypothetical protein KME14_03285 [Tildeniella torsiva UHER 1998/13D]|nr:hypothetical protein [Tildeniella torsiva UHER 1998/13D]
MSEERVGEASPRAIAPSPTSDRNAPNGYLNAPAGNANAGSGNAITTVRSSMSGSGYAKAGA